MKTADEAPSPDTAEAVVAAWLSIAMAQDSVQRARAVAHAARAQREALRAARLEALAQRERALHHGRAIAQQVVRLHLRAAILERGRPRRRGD